MARQQNMSMFSGNDRILEVTVLDAATGQPFNLTSVLDVIWAIGAVRDVDGYCRQWSSWFRRCHSVAPAPPSIRFQKSLAGGDIEIVDGPAGLLRVTIDAEDTEPLSGDFYHEMRITTSADKKNTVMYGRATIFANMISS